MNKPLLGVILGGVLGAFDGLSALVSEPTPEIKAGIVGIVIGSTFKGLIVGLIAGWYARKVNSVPKGLLVGALAGAFFAALICVISLVSNQPPYWVEIVIPGTIVGLIVGWATQKYGKPALAALLLATLLAPASFAQGVDAKTAFERLRGFAGDWKGNIGTAEGPPAEVRYRVTAGGTAVFETLDPGGAYEMVSVYHLDGDELRMTHYCAGGNQPKMRLDRAASTATELRFVFEGGTNLDPEKDAHIHDGSIQLGADGAMNASWRSFANGKPGDTMVFLLKKAGS